MKTFKSFITEVEQKEPYLNLNQEQANEDYWDTLEKLFRIIHQFQNSQSKTEALQELGKRIDNFSKSHAVLEDDKEKNRLVNLLKFLYAQLGYVWSKKNNFSLKELKAYVKDFQGRMQPFDNESSFDKIKLLDEIRILFGSLNNNQAKRDFENKYGALKDMNEQDLELALKFVLLRNLKDYRDSLQRSVK